MSQQASSLLPTACVMASLCFTATCFQHLGFWEELDILETLCFCHYHTVSIFLYAIENMSLLMTVAALIACNLYSMPLVSHRIQERQDVQKWKDLQGMGRCHFNRVTCLLPKNTLCVLIWILLVLGPCRSLLVDIYIEYYCSFTIQLSKILQRKGENKIC